MSKSVYGGDPQLLVLEAEGYAAVAVFIMEHIERRCVLALIAVVVMDDVSVGVLGNLEGIL